MAYFVYDKITKQYVNLLEEQKRDKTEGYKKDSSSGFIENKGIDKPSFKWKNDKVALPVKNLEKSSNRATRVLPQSNFQIDKQTAIVMIDPQNDFLSPNGAAWGILSKSVIENQTVNHLLKLLEVANRNGMLVFVSPHYYFPHDHNWLFEGVGEKLMHQTKMFDRKGELTLDGFLNSGADWLTEFKPYINRSNVILTSPHKIYGPQTNDLTLQLRKHGVSKILLCGMSANLCVESHLRELIEQGFEVAVIKDATAGPIIEEEGLNGYTAALTNFRFIASHLFTTAEILQYFKR